MRSARIHRRRSAALVCVAAVTVPGVAATATAAGSGSITHYKIHGTSGPGAITLGPDRAVWLPNGDNTIRRITTKGKITIYHHRGIHGPEDIAAQPHGALWFTSDRDSIGRISTKGKITIFHNGGVNDPQGIAAGPDGAMWFTDYYADAIGRISRTGKFTFYKEPVHPSAPIFITSGPGGACGSPTRTTRSAGSPPRA